MQRREEVQSMSVRLPLALRADLERIARQEDRPIASVIRRLIAAGIAAQLPQQQVGGRQAENAHPEAGPV